VLRRDEGDARFTDASAPNFDSDSHSMNFAGDFAILQMGDQRHADWISNFVPCAE
jgi:hypothetical protein